jgi:ribosomal-protein-serine acetyltransferase
MFRVMVADGIEIRQFMADEADTVFAVVDRNREYLRQWLPWVDSTHSAQDVGHFIAGATAQFEAGLGPNAGIWLDGEFAGSIGCHTIDRIDRTCNIGYWIAAGHQGKGTITRCCLALLDYLFAELKLHRVAIRCATGNTRSCAIPRRLGFSHEGVLRESQWVNDHWVDLDLWAMLRQDWRRDPQTATAERLPAFSDPEVK